MVTKVKGGPIELVGGSSRSNSETIKKLYYLTKRNFSHGHFQMFYKGKIGGLRDNVDEIFVNCCTDSATQCS